MNAEAVYEELVDTLRELGTLGSIQSVLGWEERTYMPRGGAKLRSEQLGLLSGMIHEKFTDPRIGELLDQLEESELTRDKESPEAVNIRETRHDYDKMTKLPGDLVREITKVTSLAQGEWAEARTAKDFKRFEPWLKKVMDLTIRKAEAYGYEGEPYNALMDDYEKGMTVDQVEDVFRNLRDELVALLEKIKSGPNQPDKGIVERDYPVEMQKVFGESVAQAMGFSFREGRLDVTTHPFCSGIGPGDTRITTRFNPKRLNDALFGIMHEAGHGLYEMGLNKEEYHGAPMGESVSLGIHESQSRMWENQVGRSLAFWKYFFPQAQRIFKPSLNDVTLEQFYGAINHVAPTYIRVEADEATYNLHILLRFELERALVKGDLQPADVPGEWNDRFEKYFGVKVDNDANGCLQDIHWSAGLVGYFPTYTLGNLHSAQFFNQAKKELTDLDSQLERGNLLPLREWLREKIHLQGNRYRAAELQERVSGQPLSHKPLVEYMNKKYGEIYGF